MDYRSELECQLSALKEMIDSMSIDEKGLPLIEKDIILERLREVRRPSSRFQEVVPLSFHG